MDLELVRTFLEVASAGSFVAAAQRLHVTQAAVSARLQTLEAELDQRLFVRNKAGARLTPAGRALLPYATQLVQVWEQARLKVSAQAGQQSVLSIGGEFSLWSAVLLNWLVALRTSRAEVALRTHVDSVTRLLDQVQGGTLDIAVVYAPHRRPGVEIREFLEEELIAVSTSPECRGLEPANYVYVDWGPDFRAQHDRAFPELRDSSTFIALGPLALRYLLAIGGVGYFRTRAVEPHLRTGALHQVPNAPKFSYSVYAAFSQRSDRELLDWSLAQIAQVAQSPGEAWA
ncbi:MAG TPA: LysR family transcriptional regulator [Polyangiaceae bacterium]